MKTKKTLRLLLIFIRFLIFSWIYGRYKTVQIEVHSLMCIWIKVWPLLRLQLRLRKQYYNNKNYAEMYKKNHGLYFYVVQQHVFLTMLLYNRIHTGEARVKEKNGNSQLSNDLIWVNIRKKGFFCEKYYRLFFLIKKLSKKNISTSSLLYIFHMEEEKEMTMMRNGLSLTHATSLR